MHVMTSYDDLKGLLKSQRHEGHWLTQSPRNLCCRNRQALATGLFEAGPAGTILCTRCGASGAPVMNKPHDGLRRGFSISKLSVKYQLVSSVTSFLFHLGNAPIECVIEAVLRLIVYSLRLYLLCMP
jgi:hypothetical protein